MVLTEALKGSKTMLRSVVREIQLTANPVSNPEPTTRHELDGTTWDLASMYRQK